MQRSSTREFSDEVKAAEWKAAGERCRICGCGEGTEWLQYAHILSVSLSFDWMRVGTELVNWRDDAHVSGGQNCLLLCKAHHSQCDSKEGLKLCSVSYLESLKSDGRTCTALSRTGRRCIRRRLDGSYRCQVHSKAGGAESSLHVEQWTRCQSLPLLSAVVSKSGKLDSFKVVEGQLDKFEKVQDELDKLQADWLDDIVASES